MTISMQVDATICQGHGLCQRAAPDVFRLDDDAEHAVVLIDPIPVALAADALRAMERCPERAITQSDGAEEP